MTPSFFTKRFVAKSFELCHPIIDLRPFNIHTEVPVIKREAGNYWRSAEMKILTPHVRPKRCVLSRPNHVASTLPSLPFRRKGIPIWSRSLGHLIPPLQTSLQLFSD